MRPLERTAHLASVELDGPRVALRRGKDGRLNVQPAPEAAAPASAASAPAAPR